MIGFINFKKSLSILYRSLKWHLYYFFKKSFPLIAAFQLTNICNCKCKMCNIWQNKNKNTISLEKFKQYIDDLAKIGCCYISLSGGEPLTIENIEDYVTYAKQKNLIVNLVTNGLLLDKNMAVKLNNLDTISISLDSTKEKHDEIRGIKGAFDKAIDAVHNIKNYAPNTQIVINTVISPWNIDELPELLSLVGNLKVHQKLQPINEHPIYDNQKVKQVECKINEDFINKLKIIIKQLKKKKFVLNSKYFLNSIPDYFLKKNNKGLFNKDCKLGYYYCDIRENNEIYPCLSGMQAKGGLLINNFKNTFKSKEYKNLQKNLIKCRYCQKDFQICHLEPRITFPINNFIKYKLLK